MSRPNDLLFECVCDACGWSGVRFKEGGACNRCGASVHFRTDVQHVYRQYSIWFDAPPIPSREHDWHFSHRDYDGAPDGDDVRCGSAPTLGLALEAIDILCGDVVSYAPEATNYYGPLFR